MCACLHDLTTCLLKFVNFRFIARHTYISMYCDTMDRVGRVRGQGLAWDHGLVPDHRLVHEISDCLFKPVIFHKSN